jgi:hypothetical protein
MERIGDAGAGFRSITEAIDTTTPAGRMMNYVWLAVSPARGFRPLRDVRTAFLPGGLACRF